VARLKFAANIRFTKNALRLTVFDKKP
jgi:hypothetical protein